MALGNQTTVAAIQAAAAVNGTYSDFASLPSASSSNAGEIVVVETTTGIRFINRRKAGLWRSDGVSWTRLSDTTNYLREGDDASRLVNNSQYIDKSDLGWITFNDSLNTEASPQVLAQNVRTLLTNNGASSITTHAPTVATNWLNANKFTPDSSGDVYVFRLDLEANPTLNNRNLLIELDIGGTQGVIWSKTERLARGAGNNTKVSLTIPVFTLGTFVANGGELYVTCDGPCDVFSAAYFITKVYKS